MKGHKFNGQGKIPRASLVLAFVKHDELYRFVNESQPIRAIARHYDRTEDLVQYAITALKKFEAQFAANDVVAVAREAWGGRLGWERTDSYLEFRDYIARGELMPKDTCGPKKKAVRRKTSAPEAPPASVPAPIPSPVPAAITPAPVAEPEADDILAAIRSTGLMKKTMQLAGQGAGSR